MGGKKEGGNWFYSGFTGVLQRRWLEDWRRGRVVQNRNCMADVSFLSDVRLTG